MPLDRFNKIMNLDQRRSLASFKSGKDLNSFVNDFDDEVFEGARGTVAEMEPEQVKIIKSGVVKKISQTLIPRRSPCLNLILTNEPRLYFTSTLDSHGKEGI